MTKEIIINNKCFIASQTDLKEYLDNITGTFYCEVDKCDEVVKLRQERDELKKACDKCKLFDIEKTNRDLLNQVDELKQENKALSFKINQLKANGLYNDLTGIELSAKVVELEQENERMKERQINWYNAEAQKYKSALEEIRKLTVIGVNASQCNCGLRALADDILDKINEVLEK